MVETFRGYLYRCQRGMRTFAWSGISVAKRARTPQLSFR